MLRKNGAMNFMQINTADAVYGTTGNPLNASAFLRQTGQAVLTEPGVTTAAAIPRNATALNTTDPDSGLERFTYDPEGNLSFDKHDINRDGVVDFNDAVLVDQFNGESYTNHTQQLAATEQTPFTGAVQSISLTYVQQIDGESSISVADQAELDTGLTGVGNTNWYGYNLTKSGPDTITWSRTGGTVTVYPTASFQISSGTVHIYSAVDPFTDSTATGTDTTKSLNITVTSGGTLQYTGASTAGVQLDRLNTLSIGSGGTVLLDPAPVHANHTLLLVGGLTIATGGKLDLGNNDLDVQNGSFSTLETLVSQNYNNGLWNGSNGITSSAAASDTAHLTTLGVILNNAGGSTRIYGSGTALGLFDGSNPAVTDVLIKYTYYGDANLDGVVDGSDYTKIDAGFNAQLTGWINGDFNYDGKIDGSDYTLIDNAFNTQGASLTASVASTTSQISRATSAVPEPAGLIALRRRSSSTELGKSQLK
jgi:hypothetical protein